jgi:streptomycin 6-kinase
MCLESGRGASSALRSQALELSVRWQLTLGELFPPTPGSPRNFVAPALLADGTHGVLKVSQDLDETRSGIAALTAWKGRGAVRLLASDPDAGALLVERAEPGTMLATVAATHDDAATRAAAEVLRTLWIPARRPVHSLRPLADWSAAYERSRVALLAGVAGFPPDLFHHADTLREELLSSTRQPVILHGDLHHFNVLRSHRAGWLAIDPKGLVGDRAFDVCQFLMNPDPVPPSVNRRRLDILCAELGLDPQRTRAWCVVHAVLNACWAYEDRNRAELVRRVAYAEQTLSF